MPSRQVILPCAPSGRVSMLGFAPRVAPWALPAGPVGAICSRLLSEATPPDYVPPTRPHPGGMPETRRPDCTCAPPAGGVTFPATKGEGESLPTYLWQATVERRFCPQKPTDRSTNLFAEE